MLFHSVKIWIIINHTITALEIWFLSVEIWSFLWHSVSMIWILNLDVLTAREPMILDVSEKLVFHHLTSLQRTSSAKWKCLVSPETGMTISSVFVMWIKKSRLEWIVLSLLSRRYSLWQTSIQKQLDFLSVVINLFIKPLS